MTREEHKWMRKLSRLVGDMKYHIDEQPKLSLKYRFDWITELRREFSHAKYLVELPIKPKPSR